MATAARHAATDPSPDHPQERAGDRLAAALLAVPALLTLVLVLHHPTLHARHGVADVAAGIASLGPALRIVHGALVALLAAQALGFFRFSARLGWARLPVAAGFLAYAAGVGLLTIPALLDGFVTPDLAAACLRAALGCDAADGAALRLVAVMIQDFTKAGLVALSAAAASWAVALLSGRPDAVARGAGVVGLACAAAPAAVLLGADVWLRPGSLAALLAGQVVWCLAAAALVRRGPRPARAPNAWA